MRKGILFLAALVLAAIACGGGGGEATKTLTPEESAWYACTTIIDKTYGLSFLDAQDYDPSFVSGNDPYYMAIYYAKTNATFDCVAEGVGGGDFRVKAQPR